MLTPSEAVEATVALEETHERDEKHLDRIESYLRGVQDSVYVPKSAQREYRWIVDRARVNVLPLVVDTIAQALYVEGYRPARESENAAPWDIWQANRMDARQTGVHRAALSYGVAYIVGLPGNGNPVLLPRSPRRLTTIYRDPVDDEWPQYALEETPGSKDVPERYRLFEARYVHELVEDESGGFVHTGTLEHGFENCPVVRYVNRYDIDGRVTGEVAPLIPLQDQINFTTFGLLMAQQYAAFRQRWVTGMAIPEDEQGRPIEPMNVAVNRLLVAEDSDTKFGEFGQTDLGGYIDSRESTLKHLATVSQVPPHALLGQMANLSAEALAAAEAQQTRKIGERKTLFGESHEQTLRMAAWFAGDEEAAADTSAQVVWRDTEARSMAATVDALGKLTQLLGVPPAELWDRVPGVTMQDVDRWRAAAAEGDSLGQFAAMLDRQTAALVAEPGEPTTPTAPAA